jgi:hypothetical protein
MDSKYPYKSTHAKKPMQYMQAQPQLRADHAAGAHSEPVWSVQWLDKGPEFEETLVSVSTDGRVCHWSMGQVMTL